MNRTLPFAGLALMTLAGLAPAAAQTVQPAKPPAAASAAATPAVKQGVLVRISETATYEDALKCFHYYAIAHETASKFAALDKATGPQKAALTSEAGLAKFLQAQWQNRITKTKGEKSEAAVNADLKKIGTPMLADANKALGGDKAARDRGAAQGKACAALQQTSKYTPPEG